MPLPRSSMASSLMLNSSNADWLPHTAELYMHLLTLVWNAGGNPIQTNSALPFGVFLWGSPFWLQMPIYGPWPLTVGQEIYS